MKRIFLLIFLLVWFIGCKPYQVPVYEEIGANETAFLVPLEKGTGEDQAKFASEEFLENAKVGEKRVYIPTKWLQTGRQGFEGKYVPTMKLIKVDRSPVTREWTNDSDTGTSTGKQGIEVESKDSIGFTVGLTITGIVEESNTAKFLYWYSGKDANYIMDNNVRSLCVTILAREFGKRTLDEGRNSKENIMTVLKDEVTVHFNNYGFTVTNVGFQGGLLYDDKEIQQAINKEFVAIAEKNAQEKVNQKNIEMAQAEKKAALEFQQAKEARISQMRLEIELMKAKAQLYMAEAFRDKWSGNLPEKILPEGSQFLFNLD